MDEVDSQESDIFEVSEINSNVDKDIENYTDGTIIKNMDTFKLSSAESPFDTGSEGDTVDGMEEDVTEVEVVDLVNSLAKITRTASIWFGFPTEVTVTQHNNIAQMIQKWIDENDSHNLPKDLAELASRA